jgi:hypothetical protein
MNRTVVYGAVAAVGLVALSIYFTRPPSDPSSLAEAGDAAFPEIVAVANDIERIEFEGQSSAIRLQRLAAGAGGEPTWIVETSGGYPARFDAVKGFLAGLSGLKIDQPTTAKPERFGEIGLAWPDPDSKARKAKLVAKDGTVHEIILGNERANPRSQYVRRLTENQTWRVRGSIVADLEPNRWFDAELITLPNDETTGATVDGLTVRKGEGLADWTHSLAEGTTGWDDASIASAKGTLPSYLSRLEFEDVRPLESVDGQVTWDGVEREAGFDTVRGTVKIGLREGPEGTWMRLRTVAKPDAPSAAEINAKRKYPGDPFVPDWTEFNAKVSTWEFLMPEWKVNALAGARKPEPAAVDPEAGGFQIPMAPPEAEGATGPGPGKG